MSKMPIAAASAYTSFRSNGIVKCYRQNPKPEGMRAFQQLMGGIIHRVFGSSRV